MTTLEKITHILAADFNPSTKISLIALIMEGRPMTVADLNATLNLSKTLQNYQDIFENFINAGFIKSTSFKTPAGIKRFHFEIVDVDAFIDSLD